MSIVEQRREAKLMECIASQSEVINQLSSLNKSMEAKRTKEVEAMVEKAMSKSTGRLFEKLFEMQKSQEERERKLIGCPQCKVNSLKEAYFGSELKKINKKLDKLGLEELTSTDDTEEKKEEVKAVKADEEKKAEGEVQKEEQEMEKKKEEEKKEENELVEVVVVEDKATEENANTTLPGNIKVEKNLMVFLMDLSAKVDEANKKTEEGRYEVETLHHYIKDVQLKVAILRQDVDGLMDKRTDDAHAALNGRVMHLEHAVAKSLRALDFKAAEVDYFKETARKDFNAFSEATKEQGQRLAKVEEEVNGLQTVKKDVAEVKQVLRADPVEGKPMTRIDALEKLTKEQHRVIIDQREDLANMGAGLNTLQYTCHTKHGANEAVVQGQIYEMTEALEGEMRQVKSKIFDQGKDIEDLNKKVDDVMGDVEALKPIRYDDWDSLY